MTIDDAFRTHPGRLCAEGKPDSKLFTSDDRGELEKAKRICLNCPVMQQCREYALAAGETFHVWGGVLMSSSIERRQAAEGVQRTAEAVHTLWKQGLSDSAIALRLGLHRTTVRDQRKRIGLAANRPGQPEAVAA
jgi:hypothetical protein